MAVTQGTQVSGSARVALLVALPFATACATGRGPGTGQDVPADAASDTASADSAPDAEPLAADATACAIAAGITPVLDGIDDLAQYPGAQHVTLGAMLGSDDAAVAWDSTHLFVTVSSNAFASPYEPLHIYLQAGSDLATATTATGKEYSSLVPALPFTPTHLIAIRRVSDSGTGGYDGIYVPTDTWTTRTFALDTETFASADQKVLSVSVPWSALGGCPTALRLALHVVHAQVANEWKDLAPASHTPWQTPGGGYFEIDLTGSLAVSAWTQR